MLAEVRERTAPATLTGGRARRAGIPSEADDPVAEVRLLFRRDDRRQNPLDLLRVLKRLGIKAETTADTYTVRIGPTAGL